MNKPKSSLVAQLDRPHYSSEAEAIAIVPPDPKVPTRVRANLGNTVAYKQNTRITKNPKYYEIKESILNGGLDHPPNITREHPTDPYMIRDGGNTRLEILRELFEETQDPKFYSFDCMFYPWVSHKAILFGHARENEMRGDTLFIERAITACRIRAIYEEEDGEKISTRSLAKRITKDGWTLAHTALGQMIYAHDNLYPVIPTALLNGLGRDSVQKIRKLILSCNSVWESLTRTSPVASAISFDELWRQQLAKVDGESFDLETAEHVICEAIGDTLQISYDRVSAELQITSERSPDSEEEGPDAAANTEKRVQLEAKEIKRNPVDKAPRKTESLSAVKANPGTHQAPDAPDAHDAVKAETEASKTLSDVRADYWSGVDHLQDWLFYDTTSLKELALDAALEYAGYYGLDGLIEPLPHDNEPNLGFRLRTDVELQESQLLHWLMLHLYSNLQDEQQCTSKFLEEYIGVARNLVQTDLDYNSYMLVNILSLRSHAMGEAIRGKNPIWKSIWRSLSTLEIICGILQTRLPDEPDSLDAEFESPFHSNDNYGISGGV